MKSLPNMIGRVGHQSRLVAVIRMITHLQYLVTSMISIFVLPKKAQKWNIPDEDTLL